MEAWQNFFLAQVGASAALAGLIFVSVSLSLNQIIGSKTLPALAFRALVLLLQILIISSLMLVPQDMRWVGFEVLGIGTLVWLTILYFDIRTLFAAGKEYFLRAANRMVMSEFAGLLYVVAGYHTVMTGGQGIYWLVPAVFCAYAVAMLDAWVLLIEVHR
jgi:modulator of FtsH protease